MLKDQFLLDQQVIFLNHGSFGACPRPVFNVYQAWQPKLETQPVQFLGVELDNLLRKSRQVLGEYIHTLPENLVYNPNATHGVNLILAQSTSHKGMKFSPPITNMEPSISLGTSSVEIPALSTISSPSFCLLILQMRL